MIIINGHDYYDKIIPYDKTDGIIFNRSKDNMSISNKLTDFILSNSPLTEKYYCSIYPMHLNCVEEYKSVGVEIGDFLTYEPIIIYFCGKYYGCIRKTYKKRHEIKKIVEYHYNMSKLNTSYEIKFLKNFFNSNFTVPKEVNTKAIENKIVIATIDIYCKSDYNFCINPSNLKNFEFFKVMNAFQAAQEIQMWIGNFTNPENNMVEIADKYKIHKHGFDKQSFRKRKVNK